MSESELRTGRGPSGRLRNFDAMKDDKFEVEAAKVEAENNDPEALEAVRASRAFRRLTAEPEGIYIYWLRVPASKSDAFVEALRDLDLIDEENLRVMSTPDGEGEED